MMFLSFLTIALLLYLVRRIFERAWNYLTSGLLPIIWILSSDHLCTLFNIIVNNHSEMIIPLIISVIIIIFPYTVSISITGHHHHPILHCIT